MKMMRLCVLTLLAFVALPVTARSQITLGVSGGGSFANVYGDDVDDDSTDSRTGFLAGGFVSFPIADIVSLTSGLYYAQKGFTDVDDATFKLDYVEIPVLLQVGVSESETAAFSLFAGPSLSFETKCEREDADVIADCDADALGDDAIETESTTFGAIFGAGARFMTSESMFFLVNGGLDLGLTSVASGDDDMKNTSWFAQAGLGWVVGG